MCETCSSKGKYGAFKLSCEIPRSELLSIMSHCEECKTLIFNPFTFKLWSLVCSYGSQYEHYEKNVYDAIITEEYYDAGYIEKVRNHQLQDHVCSSDCSDHQPVFRKNDEEDKNKNYCDGCSGSLFGGMAPCRCDD